MLISLTNVVLESTATAHSNLNFSLSNIQLIVHGLGTIRTFPLVEAIPGKQLRLEQVIEISPTVPGILVSAQTNDGIEIGHSHLDLSKAREKNAQRFFAVVMDGDDGTGHLRLSWEIQKMDSIQARMISDKAHQHFSRFQANGNLSEINNAVHLQRQAVALTPRNIPGNSRISDEMGDFGMFLLARFERIGDISDLKEAIKVHTDGVSLTSPSSPTLPHILTYLGISYQLLFDQTGNRDYLEQAIELQRKSIGLTPESHQLLPRRLTNLANSIGVQYQHTSISSDVEDAIGLLRRAVLLTSDNDPAQPGQLMNLGVLFESRFRQTGQLSDIEESIRLGRKAVLLMPKGHPGLPALLMNLGGFLLGCFEQTGDLSHLHQAIRERQRAAHILPSDHAMRWMTLDSLGSAFLRCFDHTGDFSDIEEAVKALAEAVLLIPEGHRTEKHGCVNNLGLAYRRRFELNNNLPDIDKSIAMHKSAFSLIPNDDHPQAISHYLNLGTSLFRRFQRSLKASDINEGILMLQGAVNLAPSGHPELHSILNVIGHAYSGRYETSTDPADAEKAIEAHQRALSITPPHHANRPGMRFTLGHAFFSRFEKTGNQDDLNASLFQYKCAALSDVGPPSVRLQAALSWATRLHTFTPTSPELLDSYGVAVRLISLVGGLGDTIERRHTQLAEVSDITLQAAAAACLAKRPDKAVEWLDQGRCLVWNQLKLLRTPLLELQEQHPKHAERLTSTAKKLELAGSRSTLEGVGAKASPSEKVSMANEVFAHTELAKEWDSLLAEVRGFAKFENFLQPSPISSLLENLPDSGPIVVVNVHKTRCDALALIVGLDEPLLIPLLEFTLEKAQKLREDIFFQLDRCGVRMRGMPISGRDGQEDDGSDIGESRKPHQGAESSRSAGMVCQALAQLWKELVKPILDALAITPSKGHIPLTRLWWCVTGPLAFLPIHAAGIYGVEGGCTIADYVVSSYIPTIGMLTDRIKNSRDIDNDLCGLLLASPEASGLSTLPGTSTEVESINELFDNNKMRVLPLKGSTATTSAALQNMETHSSIHFACHATQDTKAPLNSGFFFTDGRLDLSTIIKRNLKNADLAFLSACETSTGDARLTEEAVHLAAGMLAAGYRGVVSTMWSIFDSQAPKVAKDFYEHLLKANGAGNGGQNQLDSKHAAVALHQAIGKLRERIGDSEMSLISWVPYVHFGL